MNDTLPHLQPHELADRLKMLREIMEERLVCAECGSTKDVKMESSRTAYHFTGIPGSAEDPNKAIPFCRECAKIHHEYWDGMWAEYCNSRM